MTTNDFLLLLGGLSFFLYGVRLMTTGLETAARNQLNLIFKKCTSNRIAGVLAGTAITAIIQSSSASIAMVIGFVNSSLITLNQAIWFMLGANIGTTVTAQLIALDITSYALGIAFLGITMLLFSKNERARHIASIFSGFGILFIGMNMIGTSVSNLNSSLTYLSVLDTIQNPLIGIFFGIIIAVIMQSSSAAIGILQALTFTGAMPLAVAAYVLFGLNIGTCTSTFFSAFGANENGKRVALSHLIFNITGTILFTLICMITPFLSWMETLTINGAAQVANIHTLFNVVTVLIFLPLTSLLEKIVKKCIPDVKTPVTPNRELLYIAPLENKSAMGYTTIAISQLGMEIDRMYKMAKSLVEQAYDALLERDMKVLEDIEDQEGYLDYLNEQIGQHIVSLTPSAMSEEDARLLNSYYIIIAYIERIGDHAMNIAEYLNSMQNWSISLPDNILSEIQKMKELNMTVLNNIDFSGSVDSHILLFETTKYEALIDEMQKKYMKRQLKRVRKEDCRPEVGILYSSLLTDFERLGDYALNLAEIYKKIN